MMSSRPSRATFAAALAALAALALIACEPDPGGPALVPTVSLNVIPTFLNAEAASRIPISTVVLRIRGAGGRVVKDTTIVYPAGADSLIAQIEVPLSSGAVLGAETFQLSLAMLGPTGDTLFKGGPIAVVAQSGGGAGTPPVPVPVPIRYTGRGFNAASVRLIGRDTVLSFSDSILVSAEVLDSAGVVITGTPLIFATPDTTLLRIPDDEVGRIYARTARGPARLIVRTLTGQSAVRRVIVQPVATRLAVISGDGQTVVVNEPTAPVVVRVTAADNLGVAGIPVRFTVVSGGGAVLDTVVLTDTTGTTAARWRLGTVVGTNSVRAEVTGLTGSPATFTATGRHAAPARTVFSVQPSSVVAGVAMPAAVVAQVQDAFGNLATSFADTVALRITTNPAGSTIAGTTLVVASGGIATFAGVKLNRSGTGYRLSAFARGVALQTASTLFNINAATPALVIKRSGDGQFGSPGAVLPETLSVFVKDALGNLLPGITVTWTIVDGGGTVSTATAITDDGGVARIRWTLGAAIGANSVDAAVTGLAAPRFGAVTAPPGTTRVWTARTSADWNTAGNWLPAGVPTVSDTLFIAGGLASPSLSAAASVGSLVAQPGAIINLGAFDLMAGAKVDVVTVAGTGQVILAGSSRTVVGNFPNLRVTGTYSLAGSTSVSGNVIVAGTGRLTLGGKRLSVGGRFETLESGTLQMIDPADSLITEGDLKFGGGLHTGLLTNGFLQLKGAFTQTGTGATFLASGSHRTKFAGTTAQTATFADGRGSKFHELEISNPGGLTFGGRATVGGRMNILTGAGNITGSDTVGVGGDLLDPTGGRWQIGTTKFEGTTNSIPINLTTKAIVTGTLGIGGAAGATSVALTGDVDVRGSGTLQIFSGGILNVTGALSTNETGVLKMQDGSGQLNVTGAASFGGGSTVGQLTLGTLRVGGNLSSATATAFDAGSSHATALNSTSARTVTMAAGSRFGALQFSSPNGSTVTFNGHAEALGNVTLDPTAGAVSGTGPPWTVEGPTCDCGLLVKVGGNLVVDSPSTKWLPDYTLMTGSNPAIPAVFPKALMMAAPVTLASNLEADRIIMISGGNLVVNGKVVKVATKHIETDGSGILTMTAGDSVDVFETYFAGGSTAGTMTGGKLVVRGRLQVFSTSEGAASATAFAPSGTHRTIFTGAAASVEMGGASRTGNHFNKLEVATTGSLGLGTNKVLATTDSLIVDAGATLGSNGVGENVIAGGKVLVQAGATLQPKTLALADSILNLGTYNPDTTAFIGGGGNMPFTLPYKNVRISNDSGVVYLAHTTTLNGGVRVKGSTAKFEVGGSNPTITDSLVVEAGGTFIFDACCDNLTVQGSVRFAGSTIISNSTLSIRGNFRQEGPSTSFVASGSHRTVFDGTAAQTISFASPGTAASYFAQVDVLGSARTITLLSDVVVGKLDFGSITARSIVGTGRKLTVTDGDAVVNSPSSIDLTGGILNVKRRLTGGGTVTADTVVFDGAPRLLNSAPNWGAGTTVRISSTGIDTVNTSGFYPKMVIAGVGSGVVVSGTGQLTVTDLITKSGGILVMRTGTPTVTVQGNAVFGGGSTRDSLTVGTLRLEGNFTQGGGDIASFSASGLHTTVLRPSAALRTVGLATTDSLLASHFNNLQLDNSLGASTVSTQLLTNVVAIGQLKTNVSTAGGFRRVINGGGNTIVAGGADADSLKLDNTSLVIASNKTFSRFDDMEWANMLSTAVQLSIIRNGDSTTYNLNRSLFVPPSGSPAAPGFTGLGAYLRVQRASGALGFNVALASTTPFSHAGGAVSDSPGIATISGWSP